MKRAFTLLELLLSVTLFSLIATAAFLLYDANARLQVQTEATSVRVTSAQAAIRTLERDLRGSWIAQDMTEQKSRIVFTAVDSTNGEDADDTLDFISSASSLSLTTGGDLVRVQYYIERDAENPENSKLIRVTQPFLAERTGGTNRLPLGEQAKEVASGIVGFDVRAASSSAYKSEWDSSRDGKWPDIVQVTVTTAAREGGQVKVASYSTKIALRLVRELPAATTTTGS